jgi:hypothetical protein
MEVAIMIDEQILVSIKLTNQQNYVYCFLRDRQSLTALEEAHSRLHIKDFGVDYLED